ncbi:MAG: hypothetical protein ACL9RN_03230 [Cylindrospermopsis raciborskii]|uniref:hypothetical protein n=1 Tax=Cylindrospermopsis raciborskii TaxID=77022 RepID=UPI003D0C0F09
MLVYLAWQMWQFKHKLTIIANNLESKESASYGFLARIGDNINVEREQIYYWRQKQEMLKQQLQQAWQTFQLLKLLTTSGWRLLAQKVQK